MRLEMFPLMQKNRGVTSLIFSENIIHCSPTSLSLWRGTLRYFSLPSVPYLPPTYCNIICAYTTCFVCVKICYNPVS